MKPQCNQCQAPLPPGATSCPQCGKSLEASPNPVRPLPPRRRRTASEELEVTQFIELPPGALLPKEPPPAARPPAVKEQADRTGLLVALGLGLLAGLLVVLLLVGIAHSRLAPASAPGAAYSHRMRP